MAFTTAPKGAPSHTNVNNSKTNISDGKPSPRDRAIAKLTAINNPSQPPSIAGKAPAQVFGETAQVIPQAQATGAPEAPVAPQDLGQSPISEATPVESSDPAAALEAAAPADLSPEAAPKVESEPLLSDKYVHLARKEKALRAKALQQEQAIKAKEQAIAKREAEIAAREAEYKAKYIPKDQLLEDPLSALSELGLTYEELTNRQLNAPSEEQRQLSAYKKQMEMKLKAMEEQQNQIRKNMEEQQKRAYDQALNQIRNEVKTLVSSSDEYEMVRATGLEGDVVELIEKTFEKDGILLSVEEATAAVEEHAVEEAMKYTSLKKIQQRLQKSATSPSTAPKKSETNSVATQQPAQAALTPAKTLTNTMGSQRKLSARERAILAFNGEKKST
jgi:hypothetical protein